MNFFKPSVSFNPAKDIPSLDGKVILVTGGNIGLGKQSVLEYARHKPAQIYLAARCVEKAEQAIEEIQQHLDYIAPIKVLEMDLSSLESVKKAAGVVIAESKRLDILMLNAGIMAKPPGLTEDGFELQFGTNYIGHALLAKLLHPLLEETAKLPGTDVRVIMLSSHGHVFSAKSGIQFQTLKTEADELGPYGRYGQSKLAMILWARHAAKLYPQLTVVSVHPGVVRSNLMAGATGQAMVLQILGKIANKIVTPVDQGVRNQLWASVSKDVKSGEYYEPVGLADLAAEPGKDDSLAKELWEWTEKELEKFAV